MNLRHLLVALLQSLHTASRINESPQFASYICKLLALLFALLFRLLGRALKLLRRKLQLQSMSAQSAAFSLMPSCLEDLVLQAST